ncbi:hypothetical protein Fmac_028387 [Flemingia macrophylla]|uniref:Uncharacterized protein n=1 Tax=Flemingia macrophylla TaxID=520843 RepID=A0ABD1L7R5_9FABA
MSKSAIFCGFRKKKLSFVSSEKRRAGTSVSSEKRRVASMSSEKKESVNLSSSSSGCSTVEDQAEIDRIKANVDKSRKALQTLGYVELTFEDFLR